MPTARTPETEAVLLAVKVVNAPLPGVVPPMAPGAAQVLLRSEEALIVPVEVKLSEDPAPTTIVAVVLVLPVIPEKGTEVAAMVEVQVGADPAPAELKNWPLDPDSPPGRKALLRLRVPAIVVLPASETLNLEVGEEPERRSINLYPVLLLAAVPVISDPVVS